ncbi:MAG: T9SS type A sorting domain-containing protein [Caldithrix sp.]|nr:T9SS type A sorting domain-containing protein [Caldithrix sp.]
MGNPSALLILLVILASSIALLQADINEEGTIYPGLNGDELRDSLVSHYKPDMVLNYDDARDVMFSEIDQYNDSVTCVYTGYRIYLNPSVDPSTDAYNKDMNTEHTWPRSKGADSGNAESDLHHLFPTRVHVNSSRGNAPLGESDDTATDTWWRNDYSLTSIPDSYINEYSEKENDTDLFEPREDHKGNAARAVFYFYTMYSDVADDDFFALQKDGLYEWHSIDPADQRENERNDRIAPYQDNKKNPFILDSTLVRRVYYADESQNVADPQNFTATNIDSITNELSWQKNNAGNDVMIIWNTSGTFDDPVNGVAYSDGQPALIGTIIGRTSATSYLHNELTTGQTYYYRAHSVMGIDGGEQYSSGVESSANTSQISGDAQPGDVIITEIMQNPAAVYDEDGEWFEIYNNSGQSINIDGWIIRDLDFDEHQIQNHGSMIIESEAYMVLGRNDNSLTNGGVEVDYQYTDFQLGNSGDEIFLYLADGATLIDQIEYDGGTNWPDPNGESMYFDGFFTADNNYADYWKLSDTPWADGSGDLGSPGYANTVSNLVADASSLPEEIGLYIYPNPYNPQTTIRFEAPVGKHLSLRVFDMLGQQITELLNGKNENKQTILRWNGQNSQGLDVSSGVYLMVLQSGQHFISKKIILLR